ncbi:MAG: hypothetical protein IJF46_05840 [Bacteroidaceae bacterium]|nr:hypothetical protein [Bacteroidaceae bacterium]
MKERIAAEIFREGDKWNYPDDTFLLLSHKRLDIIHLEIIIRRTPNF